jgi:uncharacterized SAM-binding protein YcdF (DUF218 family)
MDHHTERTTYTWYRFEVGAKYRRPRIAAIALLVAMLVVASVVAGRYFLLPALGSMLVVSDDLHHADVIHVLAMSDERIIHGTNLYRLGYADRIFFTGGWCSCIQDTSANHGAKLAMARGVPAQAISTAKDDGGSEGTYDEAVRLRQLIAASPTPIRSVIVVSDPYHMRRAQWTFRWVLGDTFDIQMAPTPRVPNASDGRWWSDPQSRNMVLQEYEKLVYYFLRYRLGWQPLSNWLAGFDPD